MKQSAGILVYRRVGKTVEVLLSHPGGPFWANKGVWSIPKGELKNEGEDLLTAGRREFREELGFEPPAGELIELDNFKSSSGKINYIWAVEGEVKLADFKCNSLVKMQWPPKSGKQIEFPEVDKIEWFDLAAAQQKLYKSQSVFINRLAEHLKIELHSEPEQQTLV